MNKRNQPPKAKKTKSAWIRDGAIAAMVVIAAFVIIYVSNTLRGGPIEVVAETITTTTTGGGEPTTSTTSSTTTTVPLTTTTTVPTTTTTIPEPDYVWNGEADFRWFRRPAELGVLRDERHDNGVHDAILSGVFQGAYQKEITVAGDTFDAWFITMYMGEHPTTGRAMVVDFYIGDHPDIVVQRGDLSSDTIPEDSYNESRAEIYRVYEPEVILKDLQVGRQYLFMMIVDEEIPEELPTNITAHMVELFKSFFLKNQEVIDFLNGESENPLSTDAFGRTYRVYFPNSL